MTIGSSLFRVGSRRFAAALLAAAALVASPAGAGAQPPRSPSGPTLVAPFESVSPEPRSYWLQEAAAVILADELNALGASAITRLERIRAFERLSLPPLASFSHATLIRVGLLVGASEVVIGTIDLIDEELTVHARVIALEVGQVTREVVETGALDELFEVFSRIARRLVPASRAAGQAQVAERVPLETFEAYIKGLLAEAPETKVGYLEDALERTPDYPRARLALWEARTEQGDHAAALEAVRPIPEDSPHARRGSFLAAYSLIELGRYDEAFAGLKSLLEAGPSAAVFNNLGVIQLRRAWTPQTGRPTYYFNQAVQAEADDPDFCFNLGYAYWQEGDPTGAIYWLREAVRRDPADGEAHIVLAAALQAAGSGPEASREIELARQLSSDYAEVTLGQAGVPEGLERLEADLQTPRAQRVDQSIFDTARREQRELSAFHLDRGRRLFEEERDSEAIMELRRSIFLAPYQAEPHLLLGRIYLRNGRSAEAIDALKISIWSDETVAAHLALAEAYLQVDDLAGARAAVARALELDPSSPEAQALLARLTAPSR